MSGSSHAEHTFSRCVVALDSGISIEFAVDADDPHDHGQRHHQEEEDGFREQMQRAAPAIEVIFDELEAAGHSFTAPGDARFRNAQRCKTLSFPVCELRVGCKPALTEAALTALTQRVAKLVATRAAF